MKPSTKPRKARSRRRPSFYDFPDGEAKLGRFLDATKVSSRDHALFLLLAKTAIRGVSAVNAKWGDITKEGDDWRLWIYGKTIRESQKSWKLLLPEAHSTLLTWKRESPKGNDPGAKIFGITTRWIRKLFDRYKKAAGIHDPITVHGLRHTAITSALLHGAPLPAVQAMADHANISTTNRYAHAVRRSEDAAERFIR